MAKATYDSYEADGRNEWLRESGYFGDCQEIAYTSSSTESEEDCERAEFDATSAEEWLQESGYYEDENPGRYVSHKDSEPLTAAQAKREGVEKVAGLTITHWVEIPDGAWNEIMAAKDEDEQKDIALEWLRSAWTAVLASMDDPGYVVDALDVGDPTVVSLSISS